MNDKWLPSPRELIRQERRKKLAQRKFLIASLSTFIVLAGLITLVVTSPGWDIVKKTFFDLDYGREVFPTVIKGIFLNIKLTIISSICIGAIALLLAILRTTRSAALTPFRLLATAYVDIFRGIPLLLVIFLIGFGIPALGLKGLTSNVTILGTSAVVITYSAYVAEVIRSGILSIHPSQRAAARSLGLTHAQSMRHIVLPQALRRVVPPLLNDFVALLKDTGLVSILGVIDAIRAAQINASRSFNYTPYVVAALLFLCITIPLTRYTDRALRNTYARQNSEGAI